MIFSYIEAETSKRVNRGLVKLEIFAESLKLCENGTYRNGNVKVAAEKKNKYDSGTCGCVSMNWTVII